MSEHKLIEHLERDIRNAVVIENMKRLDWKGRLRVHFNRNGFYYATAFCAAVWVVSLLWVTRALADEAPKVTCPTQEPCRILILTPQEEKALTGPNGVLDTAAQGRALELGQFAVYLKTRISASPMGDPKPQEKSPDPVDKK